MNKKQIANKDNDTLDILREVGKALTSTFELDQVLGVIMEMIGNLYQPKNWSLLMVDEEVEELYFAVAVGDASESLSDIRLKFGEGVAGWVAERQEPVIIMDAYEDKRFAKWVDNKSGFKTDSMVCVPMVSKGKTLGVIELINFSESMQAMESVSLLEALADFAAIAIENSRYVNKVRELTIIDDCSGLYNARHMHTLLDVEIGRAIRYNYKFSIVFLDLDHFKDVNDTYGHLVGSKLLYEIAVILKNKLRNVDFAIRYGGDEFVIILPQTERDDAVLVASRLRDALNEAVFFKEEDLNIQLTASFGIATFPDDGNSKEDILRKADKAMYCVKESTRNGIFTAQELKE
jgi:diguanylate cyclase (GGDEF)-like protein